jgi:TPR repeat protein
LFAISRLSHRHESILTEIILLGQYPPTIFQDLAIAVHNRADRGCRFSQTLFALCLTIGRGVQPNPLLAALYFNLAAEQGSSLAWFMSGINIMNGHGIGIDKSMALYCFRQCVEQYPNAWFWIAILLLEKSKLKSRLENRYRQTLEGVCDDLIVSSEEREAIDAVKESVDRGNLQLCYVYGFCVELGFGVERDPVQAIPFYLRAVNGGSTEASYRAWVCLRESGEMLQQQILASEVLKAAVDFGSSEAQYEYAMILGCGLWGERDWDRCRAYLAKAGISGNVNAQIAILTMENEFGEDLRECFAGWRSKLNREERPESVYECPSAYDRRLDPEKDRVITMRGYVTGWARSLRASSKA